MFPINDFRYALSIATFYYKPFLYLHWFIHTLVCMQCTDVLVVWNYLLSNFILAYITLSNLAAVQNSTPALSVITPYTTSNYINISCSLT